MLSLLLSFGLILILMYGIIPGFTKVGGWFELFFVNTLGMSYNSGVIAYLLLLVASTIWALLESLSDRGDMKRARIAFLLSIGLAGILFIGNSVWLWLLLIGTAIYLVFTGNRMNFKFINLSMSSLLVILIGFSAYAIIPIRSSANPRSTSTRPKISSRSAAISTVNSTGRPPSSTEPPTLRRLSGTTRAVPW